MTIWLVRMSQMLAGLEDLLDRQDQHMSRQDQEYDSRVTSIREIIDTQHTIIDQLRAGRKAGTDPR